MFNDLKDCNTETTALNIICTVKSLNSQDFGFACKY